MWRKVLSTIWAVSAALGGPPPESVDIALLFAGLSAALMFAAPSASVIG